MIDCPLPQVSGPILIKSTQYSLCIDNSPAPETLFYSHGTVFTLEYCRQVHVSYELEHVSIVIVDEVSDALNRNSPNLNGSNLISMFHLLFTTNGGTSGMLKT